MAVTLLGTSSGNQGLFNRLGAIGYLINLVNDWRGGSGAAKLPSEIADVAALFDGATAKIRNLAVPALLTGQTAMTNAMGSQPGTCRAIAAQTLIGMFDADLPLPTPTVAAALEQLKKQMLTATTHYVDANTVSVTATSTGNTGNGALVTSTLNGDGSPLENLLAETILLTVPAAGVIRARGAANVSDHLSHLWPAGTGADANFAVIDSATGSGSLLTNGNFEAITANVPDGWTLITGTAGTHLLQETTTIYTGAKSVAVVGDGATLTQIRQAITGLTSKTPYALNLFARMSAAPAAGVLTVDLFDGTSVINDTVGTANSFTIDLPTLGTTFVAKNGVFRLPDPVPANVYLRFRLSTALSASRTLYLDHAALAGLNQIQPTLPGSSPYAGFFTGSVPWPLDDGTGARVFKLVTANNRASDWQTLFDRFFETSKTGFQLPVAGTTLINDNLIT